MKLSQWARDQGVRYETAYRWFRRGQLPVPAEQLASGTILVHPERSNFAGAALYARVSSSDQRADLDRQVARLSAYAAQEGLRVVQVASEIGSGLNGHRPKLLALLRDPRIGVLVVEHRDRLARFGAEYIEAALQAGGRRLVIMDEGEVRDDLAQDMIEVLTSFCARLYGRRSAKGRARRAMQAIEEDAAAEEA